MHIIGMIQHSEIPEFLWDWGALVLVRGSWPASAPRPGALTMVPPAAGPDGGRGLLYLAGVGPEVAASAPRTGTLLLSALLDSIGEAFAARGGLALELRNFDAVVGPHRAGWRRAGTSSRAARWLTTRGCGWRRRFPLADAVALLWLPFVLTRASMRSIAQPCRHGRQAVVCSNPAPAPSMLKSLRIPKEASKEA